MEKEQLLLAALEWQKILEPMIDEDYLETVFKLAVKSHETSFAINMHDLVNAFHNLFVKPIKPSEYESREAEMIAKGFPPMGVRPNA